MTSEKNNNFGIVITCYRGDIYLTKGLLASIRYFCGDIPVCLIVDGDFSIQSLLKAYKIDQVIRKKDVKNPFLRENLFGTRMTKMIAFWEGPYDYFLFLDTDVVLWGNPVLSLDIDGKTEFWHNLPHEPYSEKILKSQYFDYENIFQFTEYFDWRNCSFFNSGAFIAKKGIFQLSEFIELFQIYQKNKSLVFEDQGMINLMLYRKYRKSLIAIEKIPIQVIVPVLSKNDLEKTFIIENNKPLVKNPVIIHWAGTKPNFRQRKVFNAHMTFFRKMNLSYSKSIWRFFPGLYFTIEELYAIYLLYYKNSPGKLFKRILHLKSSS